MRDVCVDAFSPSSSSSSSSASDARCGDAAGYLVETAEGEVVKSCCWSSGGEKGPREKRPKSVAVLGGEVRPEQRRGSRERARERRTGCCALERES